MVSPDHPAVLTGAAYRRAWSRLDARTRRRVNWAVARGRPVDDPRDAALAVANARERERWGLRGLGRYMAIILVIVGVGQLGLATTSGAMLVAHLGLGLFSLAVGAWWWRMPRIVARAERLNRAILERASVREPAAEGTPTRDPAHARRLPENR